MAASNSGQSLIELLVAIGIAGIFITGATLSVDVALRSTSQNKLAQPAGQLAQALLDTVVVAARAKWQTNIAALVVGTHYFINGVGDAVSGDETKTPDASGPTYTRFFTVADVSPVDPSQRIVTVSVTWPAGVSPGSVTISRIMTRNQNAVFRQTDWSGGATNDASAVFGDQTRFYKSSTMDSSAGGVLFITGLPHPS